MLIRLKSDYKHDDNYTNLGIHFSPTVNIPARKGLIVEITVHTEMASEPIQFKIDGTYVHTPLPSTCSYLLYMGVAKRVIVLILAVFNLAIVIYSCAVVQLQHIGNCSD